MYRKCTNYPEVDLYYYNYKKKERNDMVEVKITKFRSFNVNAKRNNRTELKKLKLYILIEQIRINSTYYEIEEHDNEQNQNRTFLFIFFTYFMMYFCLGILPPNIANIINLLPFTTSSGFGIVISLNLLIGMLTMIILGYFGDRIYAKVSRKGLFFIMNMIWIICYGLISLVSNFSQIVILIVVGAIGIGSFLPLGFSMVSDLFTPEQRGAKFGMMHIALVFGNGCGMLLGSIFGSIGSGTGWRLIYSCASVISAIPLLCFFFFGKERIREVCEKSFYTYRFKGKEALNLLRKKSILGILGTVLGSWIAMSTLATWSILYLTKTFKNNSFATLIFLIAGLGALPGAIIGGKLGDMQYQKGKARGRINISFLGTIHGIICFIVFYIFPTLFFFGLLGYFLTAFTIGNQFALYTELIPPKLRSSINALNGIMMNTGGIMGNLLISMFIQINISLLQGAILCVLSVWFVSALLWIYPFSFYEREKIIK